MAPIHSRAYLLIEQQLRCYEANPLPGVQLYPTYAGNMFTLSAKIKGVKGTAWEGGILKLRLQFTENFNYVPPEAHFVTVPFHPNVNSETGRVASRLLDDPQKWNASVTLTDVLADIQLQLANPDRGLVANEEAAAMLRDRQDEYRSIVAECVRMSQIVENSPELAGSPSPSAAAVGADASATRGRRTPTIEYDEEFLRRPRTRPPPAQKKVSYETYHADWSRLATSQPACDAPFCPEMQWSDPEVLSAKMHEHRRLKYGNVGVSAARRQLEKESGLQRVEHMRKLYMSHKHASNVSAGREPPIPTAAGQYPEDEEVDELVRWTNDLPAQPSAAAAAE